jgi:hypothetical protein
VPLRAAQTGHERPSIATLPTPSPRQQGWGVARPAISASIVSTGTTLAAKRCSTPPTGHCRMRVATRSPAVISPAAGSTVRGWNQKAVLHAVLRSINPIGSADGQPSACAERSAPRPGHREVAAWWASLARLQIRCPIGSLRGAA